MADPKAGEPCPKCEKPLEAHQNVFYHIGLGMYPGLVCQDCKLCMDDPDCSFIGAVKAWAREAQYAQGL